MSVYKKNVCLDLPKTMFLSMCTLFYKGFILDVCMTRIQKSGKYDCTFS